MNLVRSCHGLRRRVKYGVFAWHGLRRQVIFASQCRWRSFHGSGHDKFSHEYDEAPTPTSEETRFFVEASSPQEAERILRILSVQRDSDPSSVASSLDQAGVRVSSPAVVADVLRRLSNAGVLALAFFRWAERQDGLRHSAAGFHHLIEALGKIKQFRLIWSLVDAMKAHGLLSKDTFILIARRYARARKIREAVEAFDKMAAYGLKPELSDYNSLLDTISKARHVRKAQEMFDDLTRRKKVAPDLKTYTILLEGWGHERDLTKLKAVYQEMIDEGFVPDAVTYGILINAFCKSKKIDEALKIFHDMCTGDCKPTPHIYCTLINGLGSEKRLEEALEFFKRSRASGFPPELPTYNALVGAYCWASRFEDAFRVMDEMRRCGIGPNARSYDIILHHLIKARRTEEAYQVFQRMSREPTCEPELNTYTMIISLFCSEERVDMALKVWKQMREKGILPCMHMFSSLINGLCYENRLDDACQYFEEMLDKGIRPPGQLYSNLKEALFEGGKKDLAIELGLKLDRLRKTPLPG